MPGAARTTGASGGDLMQILLVNGFWGGVFKEFLEKMAGCFREIQVGEHHSCICIYMYIHRYIYIHIFLAAERHFR